METNSSMKVKSKTLKSIFEEANEIMFLENRDWRVAFKLRKLEAP